MKNLIIYAHPNPKSFSHAVKEKIVESFQKKSEETMIRDLYKIDFNPILSSKDFELIMKGQTPEDVKVEQTYIKNADRLIFVNPIWWAGMPAIMKGYIDRVFLNGFAYKIENGELKPLLKDKKAIILNMHGAPTEYYRQIGMHETIKMGTDSAIFNFCGIQVQEHKFYGGVPSVDESQRKQWLEEIAELIKKL